LKRRLGVDKHENNMPGGQQAKSKNAHSVEHSCRDWLRKGDLGLEEKASEQLVRSTTAVKPAECVVF